MLCPLLLCVAPALPQLPVQPSAPNRLTELEQAAGWRLLFDGTTQGWRRFGQESFPESGWDVRDGALYHAPKGGGGDIVFDETFGDFELEFEWRVAPGANSGVKYLVQDPMKGGGSMLGPEFQVLDDAEHADGRRPLSSSGALYALYPAENKPEVGAGRFHHSRIVHDGGRIEHWIDGHRVVSCTVGSDDWKDRIGRSKFALQPAFAKEAEGLIGFQDHGDEVWFRNVKLRELDALPGEERALVTGPELEGWRMTGDASYTVDAQGTVLGESTSGAHTFLMTERTYADFRLELDVRTEDLGNSGVQVRSRQRENGKVYGYQIEIDPSPRAWSGGLYEEGARGWLQNLADNPAGRQAFQHDEWNRYTIECVGPWIRVWVDGIPTVDYFDAENLEGFVALQVHGGRNTRVRWRDVTLRELGRHAFEPATLPADLPPDFTLRLHARTTGPAWLDLQHAGGRRAVPLHAGPTKVGEEGSVVTVMLYGERLTVTVDGKQRVRSLDDLPELPAEAEEWPAAEGSEGVRVELRGAAEVSDVRALRRQ